jgi:hypothetical protein
MNRIQKISLSVFSAALLAGATVALPSHAAAQSTSPSPSASSASQTQDLQSVSGKITSVSGKTFTLSTASASPSSPAGQQFQASPSAAGQSMTFSIDDNTTVSGKLAVGASADVTYRTSAGENVAVSVRVSS